MGFLGGSVVKNIESQHCKLKKNTKVLKNPPDNAGDMRWCGFDLWIQKTPCRRVGQPINAWRIPWTEEPGGLWSIVLQRIGHSWSDIAHMHWREYLAKHNGVKKRERIIERIIFSEFSGESYLETTPYDIYMNHSKNHNKVLALWHF